jgi:hypothetical protein
MSDLIQGSVTVIWKRIDARVMYSTWNHVNIHVKSIYLYSIRGHVRNKVVEKIINT